MPALILADLGRRLHGVGNPVRAKVALKGANPLVFQVLWLAERQFSKKSNTSRRLWAAEAKDEAMALS